MAPTCYLEQPICDSRLMNEALADRPEAALLYRKWMVNSDAARDPQAFIIAPESAIAVAQAIVRASDAYHAGQAAGLTAVGLMREAHAAGALRIPARELPWLDRLQRTLETLPADEMAFADEMLGVLDVSKFVACDYDLT